MRFGLTLALVFSAVLISAASWWRFGNVGRMAPTIVNLEQVDTEDYYNNEKFFVGPSADTLLDTSSTSKPLTNTDIIARNLVLSYIDTAVNGGGVVNSNTLNSIAEHYVTETGYLHTFSSVSPQEISTVQDNESNARKYASKFSKIYSTYTWEITLLTENHKDTEALAKAYENMSAALKALPVPSSLSPLHLQLINNHASTAAAIRSMGEVETDPLKTIAGLSAIKENALKEASILANIDRILSEKYDTL